MSQKIDPREVLTYLNELGYTNISAQQLKEFITDLKKLMKYEKKHKEDTIENVNSTNYSTSNYASRCCDEPYCPNNKSNVTEGKQNQNDIFGSFYNQPTMASKAKNNIENVCPTSYCASNYRRRCCDEPSCPNNKSNIIEDKQNENDIVSSLYSQPTMASKAKEVSKRERQISVHIVRPRSNSPNHDHCIHVEKQTSDNEAQLKLIKNNEVPADRSKLEADTESTIKSIRPSSKQTVTSQTSLKGQRPKSAFIRSGLSKPINKSDPVALYHYYQKEWKKQKFPGQETHMDLRWAVREKMLSGPKVDVISRPSSCRRSYNSWKG